MYTAAGKLDKREYLDDFKPLVRRIAHYMMARLPASVELDDIMQAGMIGLLDAVDRYEGGLGAQFESYAAQRIRGAILDELRQADWLPRSARRNMRRIEQAVNTLEQRHGRAPNEPEIARELGMPLDEYQEMLESARGCQLVHLEDLSESETNHFLDSHRVDRDEDPLDRLLDRSRRALLIKAIEELPEREKLVMGMHYEQELNLREIGEVLGVSESRVCQLHSQAIARLRTKLKNLREA
ncbi:MAG TPA: RNA polymerase sigma factor FliA [Burkholderiales bacterium]|nr:RNA polymerase sigma factor FliA [Burkholderiales bacterium]